MALARFSMRSVRDGTWSVVDNVTGEVADVDSVAQRGLKRWQADCVACLLNHLNAPLINDTLQ